MTLKTFAFLSLALATAIAGMLLPTEEERVPQPPAAMVQSQPITTQAPNGKLALNHAHGW
jgi:hypothetical protein